MPTNYEQWKGELETAASRFGNPDAAQAEVARQERLAFQSLCKMLMDSYTNVLTQGVPEEAAIAMVEEQLTLIINHATAQCPRTIREAPEERDALLEYWEWYLDFFKGWRETVRGNNRTA